jgi:predicted ABC-type exoprotein transport system permease subunit
MDTEQPPSGLRVTQRRGVAAPFIQRSKYSFFIYAVMVLMKSTLEGLRIKQIVIIEDDNNNQKCKIMSSFTDLTGNMQLHEARHEVKRPGSMPLCLPIRTINHRY